ncbi:amidase [Bradyrhizobium manausense]|uniref:amidase n=1 Tax=Bradyrhizobium manausense TaxID=989370 RepID=UPI001BA54EBE|nr:amidase [Bradyrhizobium manausense]MBR0828642.1 amidase [Bradyrhizobium manausense]
MTGLDGATLAELSRSIAAREISPVELVESCIARIKRFDVKLNSVLLLLEEQACTDARLAETELAAGRRRSPLHGIPIGLKDIFATAGVRTTAHSAVLCDHVPREDATVVRLLREAGAVMPAKLAAWEFAVGGSAFDLPWPPARNPWNLDCDPSGSSSGSAVAVAAGLLPGAIGSDTGGSIRNPAAWCGIAGHKPTYGLVSRRGMLPLSWSLDHAGPMSWTAEDCALLMDVIAAHDPADPASADVPKINFAGAIAAGRRHGLKGIRIGVVRHFYERDHPCTSSVLTVTQNSIDALRELGAETVDVVLPAFDSYAGAGDIISRSESWAAHESWLRADATRYGAGARRYLVAGAFVSAADYLLAQRRRSELIKETFAALDGLDAIIFPTARTPAGPIGIDAHRPGTPTTFYGRPFNLVGGPALSICNGFSPDGLPIGLQIASRPFEDATVLRIGDVLERSLGTRTRRPLLMEEKTCKMMKPS